MRRKGVGSHNVADMFRRIDITMDFYKPTLCVVLLLSLISAKATALECPDQIIQVSDWNSSIQVDYEINVTTGLGVTFDPAANSTFDVGVTLVSVNTTNGDNCTFNVTVLANPVCPDNIRQSTDPSSATAMVTWEYPVENRLDLFPLTSDPVNGSTFNLGLTSVTVSLMNYMEYNCTFTVEVTDEETPTLMNCPGDLEVNNSAIVTWLVPTATDNTGDVILTSTHAPGNYFPFNVSTEVTYTALDGFGNMNNCSFNVLVVRDGSPEISDCPTDREAQLTPGETSVAVMWMEPSATSPMGQRVTSSNDYSPGERFSLGTTRVTYTFTDEDGTHSKCSFRVSVSEMPDLDEPTTICTSPVVVYAPPGTVELNVNWTEPVFNDLADSGNLIITQTKKPGDIFPPGSSQVLYVAMDQNYNSKQCIIEIIVNVTDDNEPPVIHGCPENITKWVRSGASPQVITWITPTATDNFGEPSLVASVEPGSTFQIDTVTTVNYTATDVVGNTAVCQFVVSVLVDNEPPMKVNCPANITEVVMETVAVVSINWTLPTFTDNSGNYTVTESVKPGHEFVSPGLERVIIRATDPADNIDECIFWVNVIADPAPVFSTCPTTITQNTTTGEAFAMIDWESRIMVTDNSPIMLTINATKMNPLQVRYDESPVEVTYTVMDEVGNSRSCIISIFVNDNEEPVWPDCPSDMTVRAEPGTKSQTVRWTAPTPTDNSGETPTVITNPNTSQTFSTGVNVITYSARDSSGNVGTCVFTVTVTVDSEKPTFTNCPSSTISNTTASGASSATIYWDPITATDNIDTTPTITSNFQSGQTFPIGSYTVIVRATDSSGNFDDCLFTIQVIDMQPPVITQCPSNGVLVYALSSNTQGVTVTWSPAVSATDNSGSVTVTPISDTQHISGNRFPLGVSEVEYTATDSSGNTATNPCRFSVTVQSVTDALQIRGMLTMDRLRFETGALLNPQTARQNLENDLDDLFRGTSLSDDFVGVIVDTPSADAVLPITYTLSLYFTATSHYNEEDIKATFTAALTNNVQFSSGNTIAADSFDLTVVEYRGQFTLASITSDRSPVDFNACCSNPSSQSYQALVSSVYTYLDSTFGDLSLFRMSRVLPLRDGSVIVPYTLLFDAATTINDVDIIGRTFNATVNPTTGELSTTNLPNTNLFVMLDSGFGTIEAVCPAGFCENGGTCSVTNVDTYDFACSCPSGFSGTMCETVSGALNTAAIIGIVLGTMALLLLLFMLCCGALWFASSGPRRLDEEESLVDKEPPILLLPMEKEVYDERPPPRQRPVIVEMPDDPPPQPRPSKGPSFQHEDPDFIPPAAPPPPLLPPAYYLPPLPSPPPPLQPRPKPPRQRTMPPQLPILMPPPEPVPQMIDHAPPAPRWRRMRDRVDRILPRRGPRFRGNSRPEPVSGLDELPPPYSGGGPIRRHGPRASGAPRFKGNNLPEPVGDMKRRLFYEFSY